ncbi:MAG: poly(3-hydroxybutyrate) depolymerase [Myxococcota bacterium]|jgi:poly(3-hydroxybutyrate) depolymerase
MLFALALLACDTPTPTEPVAEPVVKGPINVGSLDALLSGTEPIPVAVEELAEHEEALWQRYLQEQSADPARLAEHEGQTITQAGKTMRYSVAVTGDRPVQGYPLYIALHGGGGAPAEVNDAQWVAMQSYYADSVSTGVYVTPRGITDEWNLHFDDASYALYDRLIENLILLQGVDPDRVYLLGFSSGGDGVYQIAPRMADRFAAVSMSAGHDNGVSPDNLYRLPILLQMGEKDDAYERNTAVVAFAGKLDALHAVRPEGYSHDLFMHLDGSHNAPWSDHDATNQPYTILQDPAAALSGGDRATALQDTNAVHWLSRHIRAARPDRVIWDRTTIAPGRDSAWYWVEATDGDRVDVEIARRENAIVIHEAGSQLKVMLNHRMLDLRRPITVTAGEQTLSVPVSPDLRVMAETLALRGDPAMIFSVVIELEQVDDIWTVR